ncbi:MAG: hypothetical protein JJT94_09875 [Bernardetiaceae bacterium]|nr:hypothetical protein [Bernardetiaceae bacterium]
MNTITLKTNIKCNGCIEKVTPHLDGEARIEKWEVDTKNPNKPLTITTDNFSETEIINLLEKAGFKGEKM